MLLDPTFYAFTLFWMVWSVSAWGVNTMQTFLILDLGITVSSPSLPLVVLSLTSFSLQ